MEDVASIIVSSFSANIHGQVLLDAAKHGVAVVLCENHKPTSLVLPANRSTDTILTRALVSLPEKTRAALWQKTVDAKCRNQLLLARHLAPHHPNLPALEQSSLGKKPHKEAICAKLYWAIFGSVLDPWTDHEADFTREQKPRGGGGFNSLLNYGYAVLLTTLLHKLFGVGLDPTFGLSHAIRERSTPLAYDLMEPFRPCVDWQAFLWMQKQPKDAPLEVTKEYKRWITQFTVERIPWLEGTMEIHNVIEGCVRGFRRAVIQNQVTPYKPWTPTNSKWAGS
jgi:CRISPR-associated protein Cas1